MTLTLFSRSQRHFEMYEIGFPCRKMDFNQTFIDTLLGGGEELIRFW